MNPEEDCYEYYQKLATRYHLNLDDVQDIKSTSGLINGYCVVPSVEGEFHACAFKDKKLIAEGVDLDIYDFLILRLFIDKYSTGKYELPELTEIQVVGQSEEEAVEWNRKAMKLLLHPLDTYEDLLNRINEAEATLRRCIKNLETFDGVRSQEKTLNGGHADWEHPHYRVYKPAGVDSWDIYSAVERGNGRLNFLMRIYGRRHLHEYILNNHLSAVG